MSVLLDARYFPSYKQLPSDDDVDEDFYDISYGIGQLRKHWCYMGEIVEVIPYVRVILKVRDVKGTVVMVAFYQDNTEYLDKSGLKLGSTIFIRYAHQHYFMDGSEGLRIEDLSSVLVLPYSLKTILDAHRTIVKGSKKVCNKCKAKDSASCCGKCKTAYCSRDCQVDDWPSHKSLCGVLKATLPITSLDHTSFEKFCPLTRGGYINKAI
ncbi:hypothetical protein GQ42DRAFT_165141 [Ramicandelaber brevisporus]|nr:hypothetical protein GQ42DRAFT_165141 [Ramicandelaber brevisporus]